MALLDAVLPLASSRLSFPSLSFVLVQKNVRFIRPSLIMSNRRLSGASASDIEESDDGNWEKNRAPRSLFHRFRKKKGLSVADITATVRSIPLTFAVNLERKGLHQR
ncbi:hypothetical protein SAY86_025819 [Trapa natans]|uniref:Uncharacterized protein n=1 Tax=Trapa natans TaxID=22666 RepID=A0AAN7KGV2_TRANT|nr:hypothetical protein SAY86_025819 [Trapa natans]